MAGYAQEGRAELQIDSISIGGKAQEHAEDQMQGQDELRAELIALRDSVSSALSDNRYKSSHATLKAQKEELNEVIQSLTNTERNAPAIKSGYALRNRIRVTLLGN